MIFPVEVGGCRMVPGAGQGMVVTHAAVVTAFLQEVLKGKTGWQHESKTGDGGKWRD